MSLTIWLENACEPRSCERLDASEWRLPGIARGESLALGRVVAASAAGGLAGRARRVGRAATAAFAAFTALATHSWCLGHIHCLAEANWNCDQGALVLVLARPSILCRSRRDGCCSLQRTATETRRSQSPSRQGSPPRHRSSPSATRCAKVTCAASRSELTCAPFYRSVTDPLRDWASGRRWPEPTRSPRPLLATPSIWPDSGINTLGVGGVYRNPDSIDNCNRGRISSPGLDLGTSTGGNRQLAGVWGSFPRDCRQIAVRLQ